VSTSDAYVITAGGVPLAVVSIGAMVEWMNTIPVKAFTLYTVWMVDGCTGEAVRVTRESA